jgi:hypothetical protein
MQARWTAERDAALKEMWVEYSAGYIANSLNVTRNAVIGRLGRLGLLGSKLPFKKKSVARPRFRLRVTQLIPTPPIPTTIEQCDPLYMHLFDLNENSCRYICESWGFNQSLYCGIECEPQDSGPYCTLHKQRMHYRNADHHLQTR